MNYPNSLTLQEFKVYMLTCTKGIETSGVAAALGISRQTAQVHLTNIYNKMGVSSALELLVQYQARELHPELNHEPS